MKLIRILFITFMPFMLMAQKEIPLYQGAAPGSESWNWREEANDRNSFRVMTVYNVVQPTLTWVAPEPAVANGTAIIVCPGGGFHFLAINHEGMSPARELAKKGITVFVLKYRLVHINSDNPFDDMINASDSKAWDDGAIPVIPLAIADGRAAIEYVRDHAKEFDVDPHRIGMMGFSAGGLITAASAFGYTDSNRPDFVAPIYADIPSSIQTSVPADAPPLFLACAQDDEFGFALQAASMYKKWYDAKRSVEMHLFTSGKHGFGTGASGTTSAHWMDLFFAWLESQGMMKAK